MDKSKLTPAERRTRLAIHNFLLLATPAELERELAISRERQDNFRASCVQELIDETKGSSA